jgi:HlyD family secretion protein
MSDEERRETIRQARRALVEKIGATLDPERRAKFQAIASDLRRGARAQPDAGTPGRVYVLAEDGSPKPVSVRTGVTDGSHTELVAGELEAGAAIIVGGGPRQQTAQTPESAPGVRPRGPRLF